jgi:hypothetical protein
MLHLLKDCFEDAPHPRKKEALPCRLHDPGASSTEQEEKTMDLPEKITLDIKYNSDGTLDTSSLIIALESALDGHIRILDWYDETFAQKDYPQLDAEQRQALIASIDTGDYDDIINSDGRQAILDEAAERADVPAWKDEDENKDEVDQALRHR